MQFIIEPQTYRNDVGWHLLPHQAQVNQAPSVMDVEMEMEAENGQTLSHSRRFCPIERQSPPPQNYRRTQDSSDSRYAQTAAPLVGQASV
jgi:hypothetical protein